MAIATPGGLLGVLIVMCACATPTAPRPLGPASAAPPPVQQTPPAPAEAAVEPPPRPITDVDPALIMGFVRGRVGPEVGKGQGVITKLESTDVRNPDMEMVHLRFSIDDHRFAIELPRALPVPFSVGTRVSFRARSTGGGPNRMVNMIITGADGTLLLAANMAPDDWTIERGRRVRSTRAEGYIEHLHEIVITHAGAKATVRGWAKLGDFYVWGSSVERTLAKNKRAPADYVGGWTDFALVHR
jgi:hypothetical protein